MTDKTGGAAFPCDNILVIDYDTGKGEALSSHGMSLRDYFAAKCMLAIIGTLNGSVVFEECKGDFDVYAKQAYVMADAMLKARG
jgi:hypothetical protein